MCSIDWSLLKDILGSFSTIVVAVIALWGFNRWRDELTGKSRYEVAHKVLQLALRFRDEFNATRTNSFSESEYWSREQGESEPLEKRWLLNEQYARIKRFQRLKKTYDTLAIAVRDAEIFMNEDSSQLLAPFQLACDYLGASISFYYGFMLEGKLNAAEARQYRNTLTGAEESPDSNKANQAVSQLKSKLKKYIFPESGFEKIRKRLRNKTRTTLRT